MKHGWILEDLIAALYIVYILYMYLQRSKSARRRFTSSCGAAVGCDPSSNQLLFLPLATSRGGEAGGGVGDAATSIAAVVQTKAVRRRFAYELRMEGKSSKCIGFLTYIDIYVSPVVCLPDELSDA